MDRTVTQVIYVDAVYVNVLLPPNISIQSSYGTIRTKQYQKSISKRIYIIIRINNKGTCTLSIGSYVVFWYACL